MLPNFCKCLLAGYIAQDPRFDQREDDKPARLFFNVAVNTVTKDRKETSYMPCLIVGAYAETCADHLRKGKYVFIDGTVKTRKHDNPDDGSYTKTFVCLVDKCVFGPDSRKQQGAEEQPPLPDDSDE